MTRRLCLATDSMAPSGMGEHMLALASGVDGEVTLLARAATPLVARARGDGLRVKRLDDDWRRLQSWFEAQQFDVVHVHAGIGWEGHGIARAAKAAGLAVMRTEHLPFLLTHDHQIGEYRAGLADVDLLVAVSDGVARSHADVSAGTATVTIHNGIDPVPASVDGAALKRQMGVDTPLILHVGRFTAQKNQRGLLDAVAVLRDRGVRVRVMLAGDGPDRATVARAIATRGLGDSVVLMGQHGDVAALMAAADLMVLPSLFEGLPIVLLEAMAAGLPVVTISVPGIDEVIDATTGWPCPPGDADALADAIAAALADPAEAHRRAAAAQLRQATQFNQARMIRDTDAAYARVATQGKTMTATRIGFIGAGGIAHRHVGVLERMGDVAIVAACDPDEGRAREVAERTGGTAFTDAATMIAQSELDALFICVPPFAHGEAEALALRHKLPFFVEKPVALDLAWARGIARQVASAGLVTAVGYHWRYLDFLDDVRGAMGERRPRLLSGYWVDSTPPPRWWWRQGQSGGQMTEQATHLIDLARYLMGDARRVYGLAEYSHRDTHADLDVATASTASILFADGAIANFAATCLLNWNHRVGLHLFGDGFAIELNDREVMIDTGHGRPVTGTRGDAVWQQDRDFIDAVQGKENRIRCPYAEAVESLALVDAIGRSAATGQAIHLDHAPALEAAA